MFSNCCNNNARGRVTLTAACHSIRSASLKRSPPPPIWEVGLGAARDTAPAPRARARSRAQRARALQELGPPLLLGAPQQPVPVRAHAGRAGAALVDVEGEAAGHVPGEGEGWGQG